MPAVRSHCRVFNPLGWWQEEDPEKAGRWLLVIGCGPSGIQILRQLWKDFEVGVNQELKTNEGCDSDRSPVKLVLFDHEAFFFRLMPPSAVRSWCVYFERCAMCFSDSCFSRP